MSKLREYITVSNKDLGILDENVNDLIRKGYQPYGSPYCTPGDDKNPPLHCLAMVWIDKKGKAVPAKNSLIHLGDLDKLNAEFDAQEAAKNKPENSSN